MFSETTKQLLEASKAVSDIKLDLEKKKSKKEPMSPLNYRYLTSTKKEIEDLSFNLSSPTKKWSESEVARAAMYLGMKQIQEVLDQDKTQANSLMHIIKLRLKFFK